jgi:hypothetical protein
MAKEKMFDLDKMVKDAHKRLLTHINKLAEKAHKETATDFAEARKRLNIK